MKITTIFSWVSSIVFMGIKLQIFNFSFWNSCIQANNKKAIFIWPCRKVRWKYLILFSKLCLLNSCLFIVSQIKRQPKHATHSRVISEVLLDYVFGFSTLLYPKTCHIQLVIFKVVSQIVCFTKWAKILFTGSTDHD